MKKAWWNIIFVLAVAVMFVMNPLDVKAAEVSPVVTQLTVKHPQFSVTGAVSGAEVADCEYYMQQINEQLLHILVAEPSFSYDMTTGAYLKYDTPVVMQLNSDFLSYLHHTLQVNRTEYFAQGGDPYEYLVAQVAAIDSAVKEQPSTEGVNALELQISARYLTAYPVNPEAACERYVLAGECVTSYAGSTLDRITNLDLATDALSERVVMPGESVSCSTVFGPRTSAFGYKNASIFQNGQKVDGIGGGICQVSTTAYIALQNAGMTITERWPHSMKVDYVPLGMDSAISYGYKDLIFRNDYTKPVYMQAQVFNGNVEVRLYLEEQEKGQISYMLWSENTGANSAKAYLTKYVDGVMMETKYVDSSRYLR